MKVLTKALIRESEENAVKSGAFSFCELMFKAGKTAVEIINQKFDFQNKKVAIICGNGNNGGDGCVIAQELYRLGAEVFITFPLGKPITENASFYYNKLENIKVTDNLIDDYDFIIDALFGIGLNRELDNDIIALIDKINSFNAVKIAVDIPSGVEADSGKILGTAFKADLTVTFIALKPCFMLPFGSDYCGEVIVADIGVEPIGYSFLTNEPPKLKKRTHNSHKGTFGTALLFCGSYGMAGAAILSAKAALRSGVGIVKCAVCESIYPILTCALPEAVCIPQKDIDGKFSDEIDLDEILSGSNALLFGCGVGSGENIKNLLKNILCNAKIPCVIDADGINTLSESIELLRKSKAPIILTPHPKEMSRLCNISVAEVEAERLKIASIFAKEYNCIVVLKGADTVIAEPDGTVTVNINGNPGMATAGSGDVLAGIIVSLLAQGYSPIKSAKAAVYLHGEAGDAAAKKHSENSMIASDIIEEL